MPKVQIAPRIDVRLKKALDVACKSRGMKMNYLIETALQEKLVALEQPSPYGEQRASSKTERPSFLWEYNLNSRDVRQTLASQPLSKKAWLIAKILEEAPFDEVWKYLTLDDIRKALPHLRMNPKRKAHWEFALHEWSSN